MYQSEFFTFITKWREKGQSPSGNGWPRTITFGPDLWKNVTKLSELTVSSGKEYESSFYNINSKIVATKPREGYSTHVKVDHTLAMRLFPGRDKRRYERQILLDNQVVKRDIVDPERIHEQPKSGFMFHVHTHPVHTGVSDNRSFGFFSGADITSLLSSSLLLIGLVTDRFWLCCKTDEAPKGLGSVGEGRLLKLTQEYLRTGTIEEKIKQDMTSWGLVFYNAQFNKMMSRVN